MLSRHVSKTVLLKPIMNYFKILVLPCNPSAPSALTCDMQGFPAVARVSQSILVLA